MRTPTTQGDLTRSPTLVTTFEGNDLSVRGGLWSGPGASCGLYADQIVRCWGEQSIGLSDLPPERPQGRLALPTGGSLNTFETDPTLNRRHITINELMICAIDDLDVKCWGRPSDEAEGQPEFGNNDDGRTSYLVDGQDGPARVQLPPGSGADRAGGAPRGPE